MSRFKDHYGEAPRTEGPRVYYTDRQGRRRWRPMTHDDLVASGLHECADDCWLRWRPAPRRGT